MARNSYSLVRLTSLLTVLLTYAFLYLPIIILIIFSFNTEVFPGPLKGFTLQWYYELWESTPLWAAFYNSLIVAVGATFLSISLALGLIFYSLYNKKVGKLLALFYGNLIVPEIVLAVGLLSIFSTLAIPLGLKTLIVGHTVLGLGYVVPLLYARFCALEHGLIEASLDLGATVYQTFVRVIIPLLRPSILAAALLVFIISFDDFVLSYFCSSSEAQTLSLYILAMIRTGVSPVVNALSTVLLVVSSILVFFFCSFNARSRLF